MLIKMNCRVVLRQDWKFVINKVFVGGVHEKFPTLSYVLLPERWHHSSVPEVINNMHPSWEGDTDYDVNDSDYCTNSPTFSYLVI